MQQAFSISGPLMSGSSASAMTSSFSGADRRRTIRIRRSSLLQAKLDQVDRPSIKIAETLDEYLQAFGVLHEVYVQSGYVKSRCADGLHFSHFHMLPKTCVFVFKTYLKVMATVSYIADTDLFGLPMDDLYREELDALRSKGRRVAEIGSLATLPHKRWRNVMMFLSKAVFQYAILSGADDLCIMVNPKHVRFYQSIFLFKPLGREKHYPTVGAPAVALRADMNSIEPDLYAAYHSDDFETDLHAFFVKMHSDTRDMGLEKPGLEKNEPIESEIARRLFQARPSLLPSLGGVRQAWLERLYHKALYGMACRQG